MYDYERWSWMESDLKQVEKNEGTRPEVVKMNVFLLECCFGS